MDEKQESELCKELINIFTKRKMETAEIIAHMIPAIIGAICVFPKEYRDDVFKEVVLEMKKDFDNLKKKIKLEEEEQ